MDQPIDSTTQSDYHLLLAEAVRVLTAAARLTWRTPGGSGNASAEPVDWAEFVTLALAGAAANIGHVEAVLAGRPGSWEAEGVRQLLWSTVGDDDRPLGHRTEPAVVDVYVDEILVEMGVWTAYDKAAAELNRRDEALTATMSEPSTPEQERQSEAIGELWDRLEEQRVSDWTAYVEALRAHIEKAAATQTELTAPVVVNVDLDSFRPYAERGGRSEFVTVGDDWVENAILVTPLPGKGVEPLTHRGARRVDRCWGAVIGPGTMLNRHRPDPAATSQYRETGLLCVFDSGDLFEFLAAKLTANDPDQGRTLVDVGGRGGGVGRTF